MKVHELIKELQNADPDSEVEVAAVRRVPVFGTLKDGDMIEPSSNDDSTLVPHFDYKHEIVNVVGIKDLQAGKDYVVIGYRASDISDDRSEYMN